MSIDVQLMICCNLNNTGRNYDKGKNTVRSTILNSKAIRQKHFTSIEWVCLQCSLVKESEILVIHADEKFNYNTNMSIDNCYR